MSKYTAKTALKASLIGGVALGGIYLAAKAAKARKMPAQNIVQNVDKDKLMGTWYEIARFPNPFQGKDQVAGTDNYYPKANGEIEVIYKYRVKSFDGPEKQIKAKMFREEKDKPTGKFKFQAFWPITADYWIIDLDKDYQYMAIGYPNRDMLWIMSRKPEIDDATYAALLSRLQTEQLYDVSRLMKVPQPDTAGIMPVPTVDVPAMVPASK